MATQNESETQVVGKDGDKHRRWPAVTLNGSSGHDPTYETIQPDHELYPLAAWGRHHADQLEPTARDGFFNALGRAWPVRGRRKTRYRRGLVFRVLLGHGVSSAQIARRWNVTRGDVTDAANDHKGQAEIISPPRIVVSGYDSWDAFEGEQARRNRLAETPDARLPYDPATIEGVLANRRRDQVHDDKNWRLADDLARELGYDNLAGLLGLPPDAERREERALDDLSDDERARLKEDLVEADIERHRKEPGA